MISTLIISDGEHGRSLTITRKGAPGDLEEEEIGRDLVHAARFAQWVFRNYPWPERRDKEIILKEEFSSSAATSDPDEAP